MADELALAFHAAHEEDRLAAQPWGIETLEDAARVLTKVEKLLARASADELLDDAQRLRAHCLQLAALRAGLRASYQLGPAPYRPEKLTLATKPRRWRQVAIARVTKFGVSKAAATELVDAAADAGRVALDVPGVVVHAVNRATQPGRSMTIHFKRRFDPK